jgi:hypothetical protein
MHECVSISPMRNLVVEILDARDQGAKDFLDVRPWVATHISGISAAFSLNECQQFFGVAVEMSQGILVAGINNSHSPTLVRMAFLLPLGVNFPHEHCVQP